MNKFGDRFVMRQQSDFFYWEKFFIPIIFLSQNNVKSVVHLQNLLFQLALCYLSLKLLKVMLKVPQEEHVNQQTTNRFPVYSNFLRSIFTE